MEDKTKEKNKKIPKWLKWLMGAILLFAFLFIILFPPVFSSLILRPAFEKGFQQATSNQYQIEFKELNWSLLGRKLVMDDIIVRPQFSLNDSSKYLLLKIKKLEFDKIRYIKLLNGHLNLKNINLDGLLVYNHHFSMDSLSRNQNGNFAKLKSVFIEEINFNIDSIIAFNHQDSLFQLIDGKMAVENINLDSISSDKQFNWPIVSNMFSSFKQVIYQTDAQKIRIKNLKISEKRLKHFNALSESIQIDDYKQDNSYLFISPVFSIDSVRRTQHDSIWKFSSNKFSFSNDSLFIIQNHIAPFDPHFFFENLKDNMESIGLEIDINQTLIKNKFLKFETPLYKSNFENAEVDFKKLQLSQDFLHADEYGFSLGKSKLKLTKKADSISFDAFVLKNQDIDIDHLKLLPLDGSYSFYTKELKIRDVELSEYLENQSVKLKEIQLIEPDIKGDDLLVQEKQSELLWPFDFRAAKVVVTNGNLDWKPLNVQVNGFDLLIDSIVGEKEELIQLDSSFSNMQLESNRIIVGREHSERFIQLLQNKWNAKEGAITSDELEINHINAKDTMDLVFRNFSVNGFDWRSYLINQDLISLKSFSSDRLKVKASMFSENKNQDSVSKMSQLSIQNLSIPEVELHLNLKGHQQLYCEKLNVKADSLFYSNQLESPLGYARLDIHSKQTIYSENNDSLLFKLQDWNYSSGENKWQLKQINFNQIFKDEQTKSFSISGLQIPSTDISGFNPIDYFTNKNISMDSLLVHRANFSFDGERYKKVKKKNTLNWQQNIRELVEKYVYIDLKYIKLEDASLSVKNNYLGRRDEISLENLDINIRQFYIDYQKIKNSNRIFYSDYFQFSFKNYFHSVNNGRYLFDIKEAQLNSESRIFNLSNISFLSLSDQSKWPVNFQIDSLIFGDFYLNSTSYLPELELGSLSIIKPEIQLKSLKKSHQYSKNISFDSINIYPEIKNFLSAIDVKNLRLVNGNFDLKTNQDDYDLRGMAMAMEKIRIDSVNQNFTEKKFLYADHFYLSIPQFSWLSKNHLYRYGFDNLSFNSRGDVIELDSLYIKSRFDRKTFTANLKYQKDQLDAVFPKVKLSGIDFRDAVFRQRFKANRLDIFNPDLHIYKDKTISLNPSVYKMMPAEQLQNLGFYVDIDTAKVYNGFVEYEEQAHFMDKPGSVFFNNIDIRCTGFSNDHDFRDFGGALRIVGNAKIMGKSDVSVTAVFPLNSKKQEFIALASMNQLDAVDLNPLIQPLTLLSAKQGNLRNMQMNVQGNNEYAHGEMILKYEDLKVDVMNRKLKESGLATFLANSFLIKKNNKNYFFPRKGPIYFERQKYRSFIHYLAHFAIVGAKTSLGVDKRKTQKKIDEALKKENK